MNEPGTAVTVPALAKPGRRFDVVKRTCSIVGCSKIHYGRGFCEMHYAQRRRRGEFVGVPTPQQGSRWKFFLDHVMEPTKSCRDWPYAVDNVGYGSLRHPERLVICRVPRLTCELWYGDPFPGAHVAHACGQRICWAGEHLRWATAKENQADRLLHGTDSRGAKHPSAVLTNERADLMRGLHATGECTQADLAALFKVNQQTVSKIVRRKSYDV